MDRKTVLQPGVSPTGVCGLACAEAQTPANNEANNTTASTLNIKRIETPREGTQPERPGCIPSSICLVSATYNPVHIYGHRE
ncbi:hypothetical protein [Streptomyces cavernicola]|uniref:Uncharacterized protein n=1 Tax=Streptomyces cavernicola TaxID=3043613 RepID=A0ABT6SCB6_9ACTN|nr:hypothetical protein [Streptomyces sp. B-S-A6]MDI3405835.1 hypothetical protein [Streptomyces sp. B-S-A6]